ncbi:MAG: hypothetical protein LBC68_12295 [Prevotellaceae bacterium]|nr:hypothetical protein [Prevotellaceae bacterium]
MVEESTAAYMSRGAAAVFQVSDSNPRERLGGDYFATSIPFCKNDNL